MKKYGNQIAALLQREGLILNTLKRAYLKGGRGAGALSNYYSNNLKMTE